MQDRRRKGLKEFVMFIVHMLKDSFILRFIVTLNGILDFLYCHWAAVALLLSLALHNFKAHSNWVKRYIQSLCATVSFIFIVKRRLEITFIHSRRRKKVQWRVLQVASTLTTPVLSWKVHSSYLNVWLKYFENFVTPETRSRVRCVKLKLLFVQFFSTLHTVALTCEERNERKKFQVFVLFSAIVDSFSYSPKNSFLLCILNGSFSRRKFLVSICEWKFSLELSVSFCHSHRRLTTFLAYHHHLLILRLWWWDIRAWAGRLKSFN